MDVKSFFNRKANHFLIITIAIFILGCYDVLYKFKWDLSFEIDVNLWNPTWLFFGPLLYFAYDSNQITWRKCLMHGTPYLLFQVFFLTAYFGTDMSDPWKSDLFIYYQNSYLIISFSLVPYSIYVLTHILRSGSEFIRQNEMLLMSLAGIYIIIALINMMLFLAWGVIHFDMGIDYRYFTYALLAFANIAIFGYWLAPGAKKGQAGVVEKSKSYLHSELQPELASSYQVKIVDYFKESMVYLTPNLSLETLSKDLDIPKHYLSQIFNVYFEKNFHNFLAEFRIAHAIKLLKENPGLLKIESLAYSCGFNSKTSFNRYFKEITGLAPSAYQENLKDGTTQPNN